MSLAAWNAQESRAPSDCGAERETRLADMATQPGGSTLGSPPHAAGLLPSQLTPWLSRFAVGQPWWRGWGWAHLAASPGHDGHPAVAVLRLFVARIEAGDDPAYFLGGVEPEDAVAAVRDWLYWAVPVETIEGWLAAGCWSARVVRSLIDRGVGPDVFFDEDGEPIAFEHEHLAPCSLASYVMDGTVAVAAVERESERLRCAGA